MLLSTVSSFPCHLALFQHQEGEGPKRQGLGALGAADRATRPAQHLMADLPIGKPEFACATAAAADCARERRGVKRT